MNTFVPIVIFLLSVFGIGSAETGCPDPEDIAPCLCTQSPFTYLSCKNMDDPDQLRDVFRNSARYTYNEVHLEYSTLQYLPRDMFETVCVKELYLRNVTLSQIFDYPPEALDELRKLHIENSVVLGGVIWKILKPLKSLKILDMYFNSIRKLGTDFSQNGPKGLEQLTFYGTGTRNIQSGVFAEFVNLDKLAIDASNIQQIKRDMLPVPWNGRVLYFNENKISDIPEDMFSQMPNLQTLGLRNNQIATIPKSAFEGTGSKLQFLILTGNPIKCDCRILWLMKNKPAVLSGTCEGPKRLHGRDMKDVSSSDMNC